MRGARILLVEDNEINQEVAMGQLEDAEAFVDLAENGEVALRMIRDNDYDVVLMDMQMPVMDGVEATRIIRSNPRFETLPIIAMTANAMASDRELCLEAGMNDHIAKPIDPDQLFGVLLRWLRRADWRRQGPDDGSHDPDRRLPGEHDRARHSRHRRARRAEAHRRQSAALRNLAAKICRAAVRHDRRRYEARCRPAMPPPPSAPRIP